MYIWALSYFMLSFVVNLKISLLKKQKTSIPAKFIRADLRRQNKFIKS